MCFSGNFVKSNIEVSLQRTSNMNAALCISYFSSPSRPYLVQRLEPGGGGATTLLLYFLLARELRLILSLELLHLRLGWPAGMPGSLAASQAPGGKLGFFSSSYLAQEISTNLSLKLQEENCGARACGALPTSPSVAAEARKILKKYIFFFLFPMCRKVYKGILVTDMSSSHASPGIRTQEKEKNGKNCWLLAQRSGNQQTMCRLGLSNIISLLG